MTGIAANALFSGLFPTKTKNLSTAGASVTRFQHTAKGNGRALFLSKSPQFLAFCRSPLPVGKAVRKKNKKTSQKPLRFFSDPNTSRPPTRQTRSARREGRLAQLVERLVYTEDVGSSSLSSPTIFRLLQVVRITKPKLFRMSVRFTVNFLHRESRPLPPIL